MADPGLIDEVGPIWAELDDRLWHTTHPKRFLGIREAGAILPEPDIRDAERWSTSQGPKYYPYVRHIGGVSLFDFDSFEGKAYSKQYSSSNWRAFVPYRNDWDGAVWIEVDRERVASSVIWGKALLDHQKASGEIGRRIMPVIEVAHMGPLPLEACIRALLIRHGAPNEFLEFDLADFDEARYEAGLKEWKAGVRTHEQRCREAYGVAYPALEDIGRASAESKAEGE